MLEAYPGWGSLSVHRTNPCNTKFVLLESFADKKNESTVSFANPARVWRFDLTINPTHTVNGAERKKEQWCVA